MQIVISQTAPPDGDIENKAQDNILKIKENHTDNPKGTADIV